MKETGARISETLALEWSSFNEMNKTIEIKQQITIDKNVKERITPYLKTKDSYRTIDLSDSLVNKMVLFHEKEKTAKYIFHQLDNTNLPLRAENTKNVFRWFCKKQKFHLLVFIFLGI